MASTPSEDDESFASVGISACMLMLCVGTVLVFLQRVLAQRYPRLAPFTPPTTAWLWTALGVIASVILSFSEHARLARAVELIDQSFPSIFFTALLPPIIFESGFALDRAAFAAQLWPSLVLAGPGTVISAATVGALLAAAGALRAVSVPFSLLEAALLGTVVSATDTVAVLTTLGEGVVRADVRALVYGESVLNDAVALVLFRTLAGVGREGSATAAGALLAVLSFFVVFAGSTAVGLAVGASAALLFKRFHLRQGAAREEGESWSGEGEMSPGPHRAEAPRRAPSARGAALAERAEGAAPAGTPAAVSAPDAPADAADAPDARDEDSASAVGFSAEVERTLFVVLPFLSYFFAEAAGLSGVVAVLFCGIVMGKTAQRNIAPGTRRFARALFRMLASLFEALTFVYIGVALPQLGGEAMRAHLSTALALCAACVVGRVAGVGCSSAIVNALERRALEAAERSRRRGPNDASAEAAGEGARAFVLGLPAALARLPGAARARAAEARDAVLEAAAALRAQAARLASRGRGPAPHDAAAAPPAPPGPARAAAGADAQLRIPRETRLFLSWCGLRGGVAFALALHARQLTPGAAGEAMVAAALLVAAVSLVAIPLGIAPLSRRLGLRDADRGAPAGRGAAEDAGEGVGAIGATRAAPLAAAEAPPAARAPGGAKDDAERKEADDEPLLDAPADGAPTVEEPAGAPAANGASASVAVAARSDATAKAAAAAAAVASSAAAAAALLPSRARMQGWLEKGLDRALVFLTIDADQQARDA